MKKISKHRWAGARVLGIALWCFAIGSASNAGAIGFVNGSFETGDTTGWSEDSGPDIFFSANGYGDGGGDGGLDFDGNYWALLAGPSFFEQTISGLTAGRLYAVDFLMASERLEESNSFFVSATGGATLLFTAPPDASASGSGGAISGLTGPYCCWDTWVSKQYLFAATGPSSTIRFSTYGVSQVRNPGLDKVSITAVPEPTSLLLLGLGLVGLAAWRRKHAD